MLAAMIAKGVVNAIDARETPDVPAFADTPQPMFCAATCTKPARWRPSCYRLTPHKPVAGAN